MAEIPLEARPELEIGLRRRCKKIEHLGSARSRLCGQPLLQAAYVEFPVHWHPCATSGVQRSAEGPGATWLNYLLNNLIPRSSPSSVSGNIRPPIRL